MWEALKYGPIAIAAIAAIWTAKLLTEELRRRVERPDAKRILEKFMAFCIVLVVLSFGLTLVEKWGQKAELPPPTPSLPSPSPSPVLGTKWIHKQFTTDYKTIVDWINLACKPRDISGIKGLVFTGIEKYQVEVWCRDDKSNVVWSSDIRTVGTGWEQTVDDLVKAGDAAVLGLIRGSDKHTLIMLRKP